MNEPARYGAFSLWLGQSCRALLFFALMVAVFVRTIGTEPPESAPRPIIGNSVPEWARIVVLTGDGAHLVSYAGLKPFLEKHPGSGFLLPPDALRDINRQIRRQEGWNPTAHIVKDSGDCQLLEVGHSGDWAAYTGYEATRSGVVPRYTRSYFPETPLGQALLRTFGIFLLGLLTEEVIRWSRSRKSRAQRAASAGELHG